MAQDDVRIGESGKPVDAVGGLKVNGTVVINSSGEVVATIDTEDIEFSNGEAIDDNNGNELLGFGVTAGAKDYLTISNGDASAGSFPIISTAGESAASGIILSPKGNSDSLSVVYIIRQDDGAAGPVFGTYHVSTTPVADDRVSRFNALGNNDNGSTAEYSTMDTVIIDPADGSESAKIVFSVADGTGGTADNLTVLPTKVQVGDGTVGGTLESQGDFDLVLQTGNSTTGNITITDGANGDITLSPNGSGAVDIAGAEIHSDITSSTGAAAVPVTGRIHEITTTATGDALTLANGTAGQRLTLLYVAEGAGADTAVLTPTTLAGGTTITFNDLGDTAELVYSSTGGWYVVGGSAVVA